MKIRKMSMEDLDEIMQLEQECFDRPWSRSAMEYEVKKNPLAKYLVIEGDEEEILAYGGFWDLFGEGHITNIAVKPSAQGQGLGKFLVYGLIDYAKKCNITAMTLEVREGNEPALRLYRSFGFEEKGRRPDYYGKNKDALILWKYFEEDEE